MSKPLFLFRLQKIDTHLDQIQNRIREIESTLLQNEVLQKAQIDLENANKAYKEAKKNLHLAEDAVGSQKIKIEQNEASLYGGKIHNPKELQDLQNEVASLKRNLVVLEDEQLNLMLLVDDRESEQKKSEAQFAEVQASLLQKNSLLLGEKSTLQKELDKTNAERTFALTAITPADLSIYERLRNKHHGVAVAPVSDESCTQCGATLTPAECQSAKSPNAINYCPSCGRILYAG